MIKKLITIGLIIIIYKVHGQDSYLKPCVDFGSKIKSIKEYNTDFDKVINSKLTQNYLIRFIAKPTFNPEYVFQIDYDSIFKLKTLIFQDNFWYSKSRDSVIVDYNDFEIDKNVAICLDSLFNKITSSSMTRSVATISGEDGETYMFYKLTKSGQKKCGECWSPSKNTPLFELVSICDKLIDISENENKDFEQLIGRINLLYDRIE